MAYIICEMITNEHPTYKMKYDEDGKLTIKFALSPGNILSRV